MKKAFIISSLVVIYCCTLQLLGDVKISNFSKNGYPVLIPGVKKFAPLKGDFELPEKFVITVNAGSSLNADVIKNALVKRFPEISTDVTAKNKTANCRLNIVKAKKTPFEQGYCLRIDQEGINISADSDTGLFYGAQTLANIIRNTDSRTLKGCEINDYPDLKLRGVFFDLRFLKSQDIDKLKKAIDVLAALKFNFLLLEFADNIPLEGNPFSKRKYTLTEKEVKGIAEYAKKRHFMIVPNLQILTHTSWMKNHPDFKAMSEGKPKRLWVSAYCPSNPKVIKLMFQVITKTIKLLEPPYIQINVDEMALCPWRVCPKCAARDSVELLREHVKLMEAKIFELGSIPIFFQDAFCPGYLGYIKGNEKVLDSLDRRDVFACWEYATEVSSKRLQFFTKRGFPILGVTYCRSIANNEAMPKVIAANGKLGCYLTYWSFMHYFFENPMKTNNRAYAGTTLAATYFWDTNAPTMSQLTYDTVYQMRRLLDPQAPERRSGAKAVSVPVNGQINAALGNDPAFPIFKDDEKLNELKKLLADSPEKFQLLTGPGGKYYAIVLSGKKGDHYTASPVTIPLNIKVKELSFLLTTAPPLKNNQRFLVLKRSRHKQVIGNLKVNYADGSSKDMPLTYRLNILDWNATCGAYHTRLLFRGIDDKNSTYFFAATDFVNPCPDKVIKSITFSTKRINGIAPALLAVSAFDTQGKISTPKSLVPALKEAQKQPPEDIIFADFESGMGKVKFSYSGKFSAPPTTEVISDPTALNGKKVLKITIPPMKSNAQFIRTILDIPVSIKTDIKSFRFDFRSDYPGLIYKIGCYLAPDSKWENYGGYLNYLDSPASHSWQTSRFPIKALELHKDGKGYGSLKDVKILRVSFWTNNFIPLTMHIYVDNIGLCKDSVPWRGVLRKAKPLKN